MRSRSLVPFHESGAPVRSDFGPFGLHREIDRLFNELLQGIASNDGTKSLTPNIEITETDEAVEVTAEMLGLERKDVEISIEDDTLTIRGEKKVEGNQKEKNVQHSERIYGMFMRMLQLPPGIDPSSIQAAMVNGVLKVTIPKPAKSMPKKVEVKDASQKEAKKAA
jgi:HSP20 family protein